MPMLGLSLACLHSSCVTLLEKGDRALEGPLDSHKENQYSSSS